MAGNLGEDDQWRIWTQLIRTASQLGEGVSRYLSPYKWENDSEAVPQSSGSQGGWGATAESGTQKRATFAEVRPLPHPRAGGG